MKLSLREAVRECEARLIEHALNEAEGSVTRAAKRLGISYQALTYLLNTRHKELLAARTPALKRRRRIIPK